MACGRTVIELIQELCQFYTGARFLIGAKRPDLCDEKSPVPKRRIHIPVAIYVDVEKDLC